MVRKVFVLKREEIEETREHLISRSFPNTVSLNIARVGKSRMMLFMVMWNA
jgi:hypothetical protein